VFVVKGESPFMRADDSACCTPVEKSEPAPAAREPEPAARSCCAPSCCAPKAADAG
jgi:hypothetical protein